MAREESCILTNMCMICDGDRVLVQDRKNPDWPGITFPGGHVEPRESFVGSVVREVKEETGLDIADVRLCGIKQFQTQQDERYVVLFFKTDRFSGTLSSSQEGEVFWIPRSELGNYPLAPDMLEMVRVMESETLSEFYYYKEDGSWKYKLL